MGLNKSKGNMYSFVTHTWNTIKGKCPHNCSYCYMKRWGEQKPVRLDGKELKTNLGEGNFIFVGSSCDMFAFGICSQWISKTLCVMDKYPDNKYLFQTKNPETMRFLSSRGGVDRNRCWDNVTACTTIETNRHYKQMGYTRTTRDRAWAMSQISLPKFVTVEPVMDFDPKEMVELLKLTGATQINIGCDSGGNNLPEPSKEKVENLIYEVGKFTKIHNKRNLGRLLK